MVSSRHRKASDVAAILRDRGIREGRGAIVSSSSSSDDEEVYEVGIDIPDRMLPPGSSRRRGSIEDENVKRASVFGRLAGGLSAVKRYIGRSRRVPEEAEDEQAAAEYRAGMAAAAAEGIENSASQTEVKLYEVVVSVPLALLRMARSEPSDASALCRSIEADRQ